MDGALGNAPAAALIAEQADDAELGERDDAMKTLEVEYALDVFAADESVVFDVLPSWGLSAISLASGGAFDALEYALDVFAAESVSRSSAREKGWTTTTS